MKSSRLVLTLGLAATAATAFALPPFLQTFQSTYKVPKGSALASAKCATCHVGTTTKMNPYGADVKKALKAMKAKTLTADILRKVEALDSDKDGVTNIAEIVKGTLPGDPKSK
jgi:mono/diheme cytochrome c family protein